MYFESRIWLPGDPLMKVDKTTMAHSLEARVPLLDMAVVHLANSIPAYWKRSNGAEKSLLKESFKDLLPASIFQRRKRAFELPINDWLKNELKPLVQEYLTEKKLEQVGLLDVSAALRCVSDHMNGRANNAYEVWALLVFQLWYERWFNKS
jgi:asparagine synthase (glutamine-hydrolysing)